MKPKQQQNISTTGVNVSCTISSILKHVCSSYWPRKAPLFKSYHYKNWNLHMSIWKKTVNFVTWFYEMRLELNFVGIRHWEWDKRRENINPENTISSVKYGGDNLRLWGCFYRNRMVCLLKIIMKKYDILKKVWKILPATFFGRWQFVFHHDNDPKTSVLV